MRVLVPRVSVPLHWSSLSLVPTLNTLFPSLPVTPGISGDVVCSLSLPLIRCILLDKKNQLKDCVGVVLTTLSNMCKTHVTVEEVQDKMAPTCLVPFTCISFHIVSVVIHCSQ